tara:strand:- start:3255 stop:4904 length:1650 start_codon:yes stop_codon:yes gene_type:complete
MNNLTIPKRHSPATILIIAAVALSIGFYGLDSALMSARSISTYMGHRTLSDSQIEVFTNSYLQQYGIDKSDPDFVTIANQFANSYKDKWLQDAKLASFLESNGFEPPNKATHKLLSNDNQLTSTEIDNRARHLGMSSAQFIINVQDRWRRETFADLLRNTDLFDTYSISVNQAIKNQKRTYERMEISLPAVSPSEKELKEYYNANQSSLVHPTTYDINYIEIKPSNFIDKKATVKQAAAYFAKNPSKAPKARKKMFVIEKGSSKGFYTLKQLKQEKMPPSDFIAVSSLIKQGFHVYARAHNSPDGLHKENSHYNFAFSPPVPNSKLISQYQQSSAADLFTSSEKTLKELAFTENNLDMLSDKFGAKVKQLKVSEKDLPISWQGSSILEHLNQDDAASYLTPVIVTNGPSYVIAQLKSTSPAHPMSFAEAKSICEEKLQSQLKDTQLALFKARVMSELNQGGLSAKTKENINSSTFSISYPQLSSYVSVKGIAESFLLYQSKADPYPAFDLGSSIASIRSIVYPALKPANKDDTPDYLAGSILMLADISK